MQFTRSKGYLTIQATEEGYSFIFYDSDLREIQSGDYDNPDASIQEAAYEILKSERMDDMECIKVDYKEFEEMTIQHSKDLLQEGELRATSEIGRNERALNSLSRAEVERGVLYHAQAVLEDMGMEQEVELLAARVYGSRSRQDLYREDSDLDVVLSYKGDIREDSFFNDLNEAGIAMAGIRVDINPIAEERITLAEYIKESEKYLDQQEIQKLAVDLDNFSYDVDTYEYNDTIESREEQVEKLTEDIQNKKTDSIKDWLLEVSEESDIDSDVITARSLLSRLEDTEQLSIFDKQPEPETQNRKETENKQESAEISTEQEPTPVNQSQPQKAEPESRTKGEVKKSVLQSLKDFQARTKAQEKNKATEKSKAHKKGEVEL